MSTIPCKVCNDLKPSLAEAVWCEMQHEAGAPSKAATPTPTPTPPQTPPEEGIEGEKCECKPVVQSNGFEAHSFRCPVYRGNLRTFVCPHCAARITDLYGIAEGCFQAHLREYHGNPDASPPPRDRVITQGNYRDGTHYWSCHSCDTGFSDKNAAMNHECERGPFAKQPSPPPLAQTLQESVLDEAKRLISKDRRAEYGSVEESFKVVATMWTALFGFPVTPTQVALAMSLLKICREKAGHKRDSIVDACGYLALAQQIEEAKK